MRRIALLIWTMFIIAPTIFCQTKEQLDALERTIDDAIENTLISFCSNMNQQLPVAISKCELLSSVFFISQTRTMVMNYNILKSCRISHPEKAMDRVKDRLIGDMFFNKKGLSEDAESMVELMDLFGLKIQMVYRNEQSTKILGSFFINYDDIVSERQKRDLQ